MAATFLHTVQNAQSLYDIAIQRYGCVEGVGRLLLDNPSLGGNYIASPAVGSKLVIQSVCPQFTTQNQSISGLFAANKTEVSGGKFMPRVLSYSYGLETLSIVNNGGDDWTIYAPYNAPTIVGTQTLVDATVTIAFYHTGTPTTLVNAAHISAANPYHYIGRGAGTYRAHVVYHLSDGTITGSEMFVMVDGSGTIIRQANFNGISSMSFDGMNITATADYSYVGCTLSAFTAFLAFDGNYVDYTVMGTSDPMVNDLLPFYAVIYLIAIFGIDLTEWTDGPFSGDIVGCAASMTTNII